MPEEIKKVSEYPVFGSSDELMKSEFGKKILISLKKISEGDISELSESELDNFKYARKEIGRFAVLESWPEDTEGNSNKETRMKNKIRDIRPSLLATSDTVEDNVNERKEQVIHSLGDFEEDS